MLADIKREFYDKKKIYQSIPFEDYFKFVIFRNPWERILSEFNYRTRKQILTMKNPINPEGIKYWIGIIEKKYTFKDWILHLYEESDLEKLIKNNSYYNYINLNDKIGVDYIINLHNLNNDFEKLPISHASQ